MFDHIGLKVRDIAASLRFYSAVLAPLGHEEIYRDAESAGLGAPGQPALWLYRSDVGSGSGVHIAFRATERYMVDRFHAAGLGQGGRDNGEPGLRLDYSPTYYAAFLIDLNGNNVEAVCTG